MRCKLLLLGFLITITNCITAQTLTGKITNTSNQPVVGASVKLVDGSTGTTSNVEGFYTLRLTGKTSYEVEFSAIGYQPKIVGDIIVVDGRFPELNVVLEVKAAEMEGVVVTARRTSARMETAASAIQFQKNTNTVASVVSSETIRRSPDRNTGDVLKRTPGASLQDGRFLIVRGLADRYNQAMLNGILLTSTEPDRKTFSFDLIPAPMVDNIIINKAFVPEFPGEWAGGLIQVNTKDIPSRSFFNVQVGTGFNTQTTGKTFFEEPNKGKWDWLGWEDGTRSLPPAYTTKSAFDTLSIQQKTEVGKSMPNSWSPKQIHAPLNYAVQMNGGFTGTLFGKVVGGNIGLVYNNNNRYIKMLNRLNTINGANVTIDYSLDDDRYVKDITVGALANLTMRFNPFNKISLKGIYNTNAPSVVTERSGADYVRKDDVRGTEIAFKKNTFFTSQLTGEHKLTQPLLLKWYGAFSILDAYSPDQRRLLYGKSSGTNDPYAAIISGTLSQQSGSRIYQSLSDYIYTAGGDVNYSFDLFNQKQSVKAGYMLQVKDRLFDAQLFANYLPADNAVLRQLPADKIFAPENFGNGTNNMFAFDAIKGNTFRYMANTILNGGFLQFDNQFTKKFRLVWGLRYENYDQLIGSVKKWDPRHTYSVVHDFLPGMNATYKVNNKTNIRLTASQTVLRPELRELAALNLYDFELNASVQGKPTLERTKISNFDLRYELYQRAGETFSVAAFYKYFDKPIEQIFNQGSGGASTFSFQNPDKAVAYGAEVEFRKKLDIVNALQNFTFQANGSYIYSRVKGAGVDRALQGQSPYLLNLGLMYDLQKQGITATLLFNQVGERIYLVGDLNAGAPDIYEAPRPVLDFQLTKKVLKEKGEFRLNVTDIINQTQYFYQNTNNNKTFQKNIDAYRFTRSFGTTFNLTFNYSIL